MGIRGVEWVKDCGSTVFYIKLDTSTRLMRLVRGESSRVLFRPSFYKGQREGTAKRVKKN